jgi:hypothetical protein
MAISTHRFQDPMRQQLEQGDGALCIDAHLVIINPQTVVRKASSLSDLKEIGCKSVWLVYISPLYAQKGQ